MSSPEGVSPRADDSMRIPWPHVAIANGILAIASIVTLAFVVTANNADILATLALALAIVAFFIQIAVFIVQMYVAAQFEARAGRLLGEIRTSVTSLEGFLQKQFAAVLDHAFEKTVVETTVKQDHEVQTPVFEAHLKENIQAALREFGLTPPAIAPRAWSPQSISVSQDVEEMETFPRNETDGVRAYQTLATLTPDAVQGLRMLARDEINSRRDGGPIGLGYSTPRRKFYDDLLLAELAQLIDNPQIGLFLRSSAVDEPKKWVVLTDEGRNVGRLLSAIGPVPAYLRAFNPREDLHLGDPPQPPRSSHRPST